MYTAKFREGLLLSAAKGYRKQSANTNASKQTNTRKRKKIYYHRKEESFYRKQMSHSMMYLYYSVATTPHRIALNTTNSFQQ